MFWFDGFFTHRFDSPKNMTALFSVSRLRCLLLNESSYTARLDQGAPATSWLQKIEPDGIGIYNRQTPSPTIEIPTCIAPIRRLSAKRQTKSTFPDARPIESRDSNHVHAGHGGRVVRSRKLWSPGNQVIALNWKSYDSNLGSTCQS